MLAQASLRNEASSKGCLQQRSIVKRMLAQASLRSELFRSSIASNLNTNRLLIIEDRPPFPFESLFVLIWQQKLPYHGLGSSTTNLFPLEILRLALQSQTTAGHQARQPGVNPVANA
jgi:hypothetical protein